jgi:cysteinyl-tRNA synthetase
MPTALAVVRETVRTDLSPDERRWLVLDADFVLGLGLDRVWDAPATNGPPTEVEALVARRDDARAARDFATADTLRDEIGEAGWDVVDRAGEPSTIRRKPRG